ncbi:MAG: response regulator [Candidatus Eisenbacteria bacterium]|uniref:Response regulator n=1 Tax=Eiseniibacteriota bacterium TaxID=2212470 RepID=A0A956SF12_UNCEI|nr:response regulator [Candidatus Eisenbacteria bacterium]MCB9462488.1 response regulator [Candidatus Eisenbacteria bacterium]
MTANEQVPVRILLVEDDPTNQYVFRTILAGAGYEVEIAADGRSGVERALASRPGIILLDMMMPVMDGYEAAELLANDPRLDGIPIIALTAKAMMGDRDRCLEAGCDDYLAKPVARKALLEMVGHWLEANDAEWMAARRSRRMSA